MSAHPRLADDAVMLGSRSSSRGLSSARWVGSGAVRPSVALNAPAFLKDLGVHLHCLGGVGGRRVTVLTTWLSAAFGARRNRVIEGRLGSVERPAPAALEPKATETVDGRPA
jgi:hypothetical protein